MKQNITTFSSQLRLAYSRGISALLLSALLIGLAASVLPTATVQAADSNKSRAAKVVSITDGDTFKVKLDGKTQTVRIVGVNTPEKKECYGGEATQAMKRLINGKRVWLERDAQQGDKDQYGRLLRFVWMDDRSSVNKKLLSEGAGFEKLYSKKAHKYRTGYQAAQVEAQTAKRGLWAAEACNGLRTKPVAPTPAPTAAPTPAPTPAPTSAPRPVVAPTPAAVAPVAAPAPSGVYYANCTAVKAAGAAPIYPGQPGFRAAFDRDNDGVGCET